MVGCRDRSSFKGISPGEPLSPGRRTLNTMSNGKRRSQRRFSRIAGSQDSGRHPDFTLPIRIQRLNCDFSFIAVPTCASLLSAPILPTNSQRLSSPRFLGRRWRNHRLALKFEL